MQREALFTGYWSSHDFNTQNAYLCGCIKVVAIKRRYTTAGTASRRKQSRVYYVQCASGMSVRVCRKAFLRIHAVSRGRVDHAIKFRYVDKKLAGQLTHPYSIGVVICVRTLVNLMILSDKGYDHF